MEFRDSRVAEVNRTPGFFISGRKEVMLIFISSSPKEKKGGRIMRRVMVYFITVAMLAMPLVALAEGSGTETGHYSWGEFHLVQDYYSWGPACYYGQNVRVVYDATNIWTYVLKKGNVTETLVQNGTAKIYEIDTPGNLLDECAFTVMERFFDEGVDVAIRHDYGTSVWYEASHNWWNANLEEYEYIWKIPGVYDFRCWNRRGDWGYAWTSGDCEVGYPDGWPPQPPHPFNSTP